MMPLHYMRCACNDRILLLVPPVLPQPHDLCGIDPGKGDSHHKQNSAAHSQSSVFELAPSYSRCVRKTTAVGFEPALLALVELESTPSDHSGKRRFGGSDALFTSIAARWGS